MPNGSTLRSTAPPTVLVVANDEAIGDLMGALVELAGFRPVVPARLERPAATIARLRPALVVLDCASDVACRSPACNEMCRAAAAAGVRVLLFSALLSVPEVGAIAARRGLAAVALPLPHRELTRRIREQFAAGEIAPLGTGR